jgi:hypothetical protein
MNEETWFHLAHEKSHDKLAAFLDADFVFASVARGGRPHQLQVLLKNLRAAAVATSSGFVMTTTADGVLNPGSK